MAALRPIGALSSPKLASAPGWSRKALATRVRNALVFLLSVSFGYFCGTHLLSNTIASRKRAALGGESRRESPGSEGSVGSVVRPRNRIHTLTTTNGSPYQNYQMRIAYASYTRMLAMPGGEHHVAFTRILHRTARDRDVLADEIPTFRADPLQPECDDWCPYPVSDRANAVAQFWKYAEAEDVMKDIDWVYMIESDYVFVKPLLPPAGKKGLGLKLDKNKGYGYYFYYIQPGFVVDELRKVYDGPVEAIQSTGPAPLLMSVDNWLKVTPGWEDLAARIEADEGMKQRLGWVREMYGFDVALANAGIEVVLDEPRSREGDNTPAPLQFIRELPLHASLEHAHAFHYTLPTIIQRVEDGSDVWKYDKREFTTSDVVMRVPRVDPLPAWEGDGQFKWIEGSVVEKATFDLLGQMVEALNLAIDDLPHL